MFYRNIYRMKCNKWEKFQKISKNQKRELFSTQ